MTVLKSITFAIVMWIAVAVCLLNVSFGDTQKVFVSLTGDDSKDGSAKFPVRSVRRAQTIVRQMILDGLKSNVEVRIAEGIYQLNQTLEFGLEDSPPKNLRVTYQAAPGARVVFSGGVELGNWKRNGQGVWEAAWREQRQELMRVDGKEKLRVPRQLFINSKRGIRARHPDLGYFRVRRAVGDFRTEFEFNSDQWTPAENIQEIELALLHDWSISRVRVKEINLKDSIIKLAERVGGPHDFFRINGFEQEKRGRETNKQPLHKVAIRARCSGQRQKPPYGTMNLDVETIALSQIQYLVR